MRGAGYAGSGKGCVSSSTSNLPELLVSAYVKMMFKSSAILVIVANCEYLLFLKEAGLVFIVLNLC